jgi:PAS domain S-box-containing protein
MSLHRARIAVIEQVTDMRLLLISMRTPQGARASWRSVQPFVVFAVAYIVAWSYLFIAAFLGAKPPPAPLFLPGAVLLCALLLAPPRRWWLYLLTAFLIQVPILASLQLPVWWNVVGFIPDAIEPILAVLLFRWYCVLPPRFVSLREVRIYTVCVAVAVAVAAAIGSGVNAVFSGQPYWSAWRTWFLGDTLAALILAPTIILWIAAGARGLQAGSRWRYAEAILLYGSLLLLGVAAFDTHIFDAGIPDAAIFLPVPLLLWASVRFGPRGIASALSLVVVLAIPAVANALGPFASHSSPAPSLLAELFQLQLFLLAIGVPLFFLAAIIYERKQAELALQASEARYRAAFESSATGMMLVSPDGRSLRVNRPLVEMLGYTEEELRTRSFTDVTYPDDLEPNLTLFRQAVAGEIDSYRLEKRFVNKQGQIVWGIVSAGVVRDAAGNSLYLVGQVEDITERKRLEQEREAARVQAERRAEELDRVIEAMADGVAVFDQVGRHLRSNAAYQRLLGLDTTSSDYAELPLHERLALLEIRDEQGQPLASVETPLGRALAGESLAGERAMDLHVHTIDGREVDFRVSAAPIRTPTGQLVGAVSIYRDMTESKRLERALAEQAEHLERIVDQMTEAVAVYDAEGRLVRENEAARRMRSASTAPTEYVDLPMAERLSLYRPRDAEGRQLAPEDFPPVRALRGEVLVGEQAVNLWVRTPDGRDLVLRNSAAPLRDRDGRIVGAVASWVDLTERRRLERERAEQAEQLERIVDGIGEGLFVYDTRGNVVRTNAAARKLLALDTAPADFAQLSAEERIALYTPRTPQAVQAAQVAQAAQAAQGSPLLEPHEWLAARIRQAGSNENMLRETEAGDIHLRALDGRELEVSATIAPLLTPDGQSTGAVLLLSDRTERNQLLRERAEQAEQLDRIFEGITDGLVVYDAAGRVLRMNTAARHILGLDAGPAEYGQVSTQGRAVLYEAYDADGRRLAPEDWPLIRVLSGAVTDADARDVRLRVLDGREVEVHSSAAALRDEQGHLIGAVTILHDQTERRQLEREQAEAQARELAVREVNERLDIFVTMAAHDLRSPVAISRVVVQLAQALMGRASTGIRPGNRIGSKLVQSLDRAAEALATTENNLGRLWRLVQQLLDVARVREGTLMLDRQPMDLAELLRACVEEQRLLNPSRVIELDLSDPTDASVTDATQSIVVGADADRLGQVVTNYLSNAERYSAEDQPIKVTLRLIEEELPGAADAETGAVQGRLVQRVARVEVRDQGEGIAEEDQATIWKRFQRATSIDQATGLGLGLYIVETIVDLHGGHVGVESRLGHGSTFWFTVPLLALPGTVDVSPGSPDD